MTKEEAIKEAIEIIKAIEMRYMTLGSDGRNALDMAIEALKQEAKTGHWIDDADKIDARFGKHTYKCSECGKYAEYFVSGTEVWWDRIKPNFCPNCGLKMIDSVKVR